MKKLGEILSWIAIFEVGLGFMIVLGVMWWVQDDVHKSDKKKKKEKAP
ncbi:MAG TPA: hypothetical protein VK508_21465 [Cyclobacteriaceae bacterium]|nr:hypothetical protein [Cyclobacteriaceae bacterium]